MTPDSLYSGSAGGRPPRRARYDGVVFARPHEYDSPARVAAGIDAPVVQDCLLQKAGAQGNTLTGHVALRRLDLEASQAKGTERGCRKRTNGLGGQAAARVRRMDPVPDLSRRRIRQSGVQARPTDERVSRSQPDAEGAIGARSK